MPITMDGAAASPPPDAQQRAQCCGPVVPSGGGDAAAPALPDAAGCAETSGARPESFSMSEARSATARSRQAGSAESQWRVGRTVESQSIMELVGKEEGGMGGVRWVDAETNGQQFCRRWR
ncbi:hypothetical protein Ga0100231_014270 [Opitutaceae bacterium TAV4]|nr:hypothetical protein Ga0100231_014270 [Opitutaceae bacterium TAV4]RRJ99536.1 hypothetical protein Ga0100230_015470 [Opitutaceae bacterium TAV3]